MKPREPVRPDCRDRRAAAAALGLLSVLLAAGCSSLLPKAPPPPAFYALDGAPAATRPFPVATANAGPTLVVEAPRAAAGYDSARIVYARAPHRLESYVQSVWVDTPARMLAPLMVAALARSAAFSAVVTAPSSATGDLRIDTELLRLEHDFTSSPSQLRLTLRARIIDERTRRVMAGRDFEQAAAAPSEDAYGGVLAANRAVQALLDELTTFASETAARWTPPSAATPKVGR
jgi:cholesterol transport system auxiliary component